MKFDKILLIGVFSFGFFGNAIADLNNGLVAYYPFNGSVNDESGNGNHGDNNGATLADDRQGNADSAYSFDGVNDYIYFNFDTSNDNTFSWSFWLKDESRNSSIRRWLTTTNGRFSNNTVGLREENGRTRLIAGSLSPDELPDWKKDGKWHFFSIVSNGLKTEVYFDGNIIATVEKSVNPEFGLFVGGYYTGNSSRPEYTKGLIDDIRIYNRSLSESEIKELYSTNLDTGICTGSDTKKNECIATYNTDGTLNIPCVSVPNAFWWGNYL